MQNKCFNCKWFFSCKKADENIVNCKDFKETKVKEISNDDKRARMVN